MVLLLLSSAPVSASPTANRPGTRVEVDLTEEDAQARLEQAVDALDAAEALLEKPLDEQTLEQLRKELVAARAQVQAARSQLGVTTSIVHVVPKPEQPGPRGVEVRVPLSVDQPSLPAPPTPGTTTSPAAPSSSDDPSTVEEPAPPQVPVRSTAPVDAGSFAALCQAVDTEAFSDDKLRVVEQASTTRYFTVDQLLDLLPLFSFGDDKVEVTVLLYPRLVDPDDFHRVYAAFSFDSEKEELQRRLNL
ncbi:MAG: DUF4476 domain-containing protein [Myxococcota bacterium]|nr:DUF4476 domain-containing protein [Myxococcota bacterium]